MRYCIVMLCSPNRIILRATLVRHVGSNSPLLYVAGAANSGHPVAVDSVRLCVYRFRSSRYLRRVLQRQEVLRRRLPRHYFPRLLKTALGSSLQPAAARRQGGGHPARCHGNVQQNHSGI